MPCIKDSSVSGEMITDVNRYVIASTEGIRLDAPDRTVKPKKRAEPYGNNEKNWEDAFFARCFSLVFQGSAKESSSLLKIVNGDNANKLCTVLKLFRTRKASLLESLSETIYNIGMVEILNERVNKYNLAIKAILFYHSDQTNLTNESYKEMSSKDPFVVARNSVMEDIRENYNFIRQFKVIDTKNTQSDCNFVLEKIRKNEFVLNDLYVRYFMMFYQRYKMACDMDIMTYEFVNLPFIQKVEYLEKFAKDCKAKQDPNDA